MELTYMFLINKTKAVDFETVRISQKCQRLRLPIVFHNLKANTDVAPWLTEAIFS